MSDMTVGDLTARHVGQRMAITTADATVAGQLRGIEIETDWITEVRMDQHPDDVDPVPGRRTASVTIGRWRASDVPLSAGVTLDT